MDIKMDEYISHVEGWVNGRIKIKILKVVLPGAPRRSSPKSLADPGIRLGVGFGIGAINISRQDRIAHICANSPIRIRPYPKFHATSFVRTTPLPPDIQRGRRSWVQTQMGHSE